MIFSHGAASNLPPQSRWCDHWLPAVFLIFSRFSKRSFFPQSPPSPFPSLEARSTSHHRISRQLRCRSGSAGSKSCSTRSIHAQQTETLCLHIDNLCFIYSIRGKICKICIKICLSKVQVRKVITQSGLKKINHSFPFLYYIVVIAFIFKAPWPWFEIPSSVLSPAGLSGPSLSSPGS